LSQTLLLTQNLTKYYYFNFDSYYYYDFIIFLIINFIIIEPVKPNFLVITVITIIIKINFVTIINAIITIDFDSIIINFVLNHSYFATKINLLISDIKSKNITSINLDPPL
jgi:hypothetical protein